MTSPCISRPSKIHRLQKETAIRRAKAREVLGDMGLRDPHYIWWEKIKRGEYV
jgi:hypothetical protein